MESQRNMANVIRTLKEESGKSLDEFSDYLEMSHSFLRKYMTEEINPDTDTVENLACNLGIDTSFLISGLPSLLEHNGTGIPVFL